MTQGLKLTLLSAAVAASVGWFTLQESWSGEHAGHNAAGSVHASEHATVETVAAGPAAAAEHQSVQSTQPSRSGGKSWLSHLWITRAWFAFKAKVDRLRELDETQVALQERLAQLELRHAEAEHLLAAQAEAKRVESIKSEAKLEGGIETARTIASLPAAGLAADASPKQILGSALDAFLKRDDERAARLFVSVVEDQKNSALQTAQTYYLAGVSLFRIGNYKRAKLYFEHAAEKATGPQVSYAPRSLAWIALCHEKLGDRRQKADAVRELIQRFPRSKEARRLNHDA